MHVSEWPREDQSVLQPILRRLNTLIPDVETQTHLLHLDKDGEILPHIDNVGASGSWILGVSLGFSRVLRMQNQRKPFDAFDLLLPSGSVYIQRSVAIVSVYFPNSTPLIGMT